ncbi:MAG TPA: hypothetical protein PKA06_09375, partial [Gemmatales bacterium]|nr:hypothetical protein [Gemmatales bacterium]
KDNQLWVTYESSTLPGHFGDAWLPDSRIQVRIVKTDGSIHQLPELSPLPSEPVAEGTPAKPAAMLFPRLSFTPAGMPVLGFQANRQVYACPWNEGWNQAIPLSSWPENVQSQAPVLSNAGHTVAIHETRDLLGRLRLQVAGRVNDFAATPISSTAVTPVREEADQRWKPFTELARQFRKRSDDLILSKRYLLRGLVVLPSAVSQFSSDPWGFAARTLEQGMYDWLIIPQDTDANIAAVWLQGQQALALNHTADRNLLMGYYREVLGLREPLLIVDTKKNESPLLSLKDLESYRRVVDRGNKINVNEATERTMLQQFLLQQQRLGFALTDDWKMMAALTQPGLYQNDSLEKQFKPFWYPEDQPHRPSPKALRVVTYANGKSNDHLVESLRERHYYLATDDIYLLVRCDRKLPGDIFQSSFKPDIQVTVQGTGKLKSVEILVDNAVVKNENPPGQAAILAYTDEKVDAKWHSYIVRVVQEDGHEAISQPMWIRCIP